MFIYKYVYMQVCKYCLNRDNKKCTEMNLKQRIEYAHAPTHIQIPSHNITYRHMNTRAQTHTHRNTQTHTDTHKHT